MDDSAKRSLVSLPMNFRLSLSARVRAAAGVPAHIRRKRRIEDLEQSLLKGLGELYQELLEQVEGDAPLAKKLLLDQARQLDWQQLNGLIEAHNRYFPIEANLPIDLHTGQYLIAGALWRPLQPLGAEQMLARLFAADSPEAGEKGHAEAVQRRKA